MQNNGITLIADYMNSTVAPEGRAVVIVPNLSVQAFKMKNNKPKAVYNVAPQGEGVHKKFEHPLIVKRKFINYQYLKHLKFYQV
jgi:hypothetical protein